MIWGIDRMGKTIHVPLSLFIVGAICTVCIAQRDDDLDCVAALREAGAGLTADVDGNIVRIDFVGPSITDEQVAALRGLYSVCELNFYGVYITDDAFAHFAHLSELRILKISNRWIQALPDGRPWLYAEERLNITGSGFVHLEETHLEQLVIHGTHVGDASLGEIAKLRHITLIDLLESDVSRDGIRWLQDAMDGALPHAVRIMAPPYYGSMAPPRSSAFPGGSGFQGGSGGFGGGGGF